jgi:ABC-type lipoprotein export system ATPase subunit
VVLVTHDEALSSIADVRLRLSDGRLAATDHVPSRRAAPEGHREAVREEARDLAPAAAPR